MSGAFRKEKSREVAEAKMAEQDGFLAFRVFFNVKNITRFRVFSRKNTTPFRV